MTSDSILPTRPGHVLTVQAVGWGEPPTYHPKCTCGWCGITIHTPYYADPAAEVEAMMEPYRTIARQYGRDIMLGDNSAYGTSDDAYRQALAHAEYDPDADYTTVVRGLLEANTMLRTTVVAPNATLDHIKGTGKYVNAALKELSAAATRRKVWESGPLPTPADRNPEGLRLVEEARVQRRTAASQQPPVTH